MAKQKGPIPPDKRPTPVDMAEAVREKATAERMSRALGETLKKLRAERKAWDARYVVCITKIYELAEQRKKLE